ncbi:MAG: adaptor protein MecA [Alicyclobacillus macrosporangiidus]|uniref:adaptor protein MecA n=1 Tax=Alicyclobacillus macrosporangiidus TaxID=392015 RepID=UPI0026EB2CE9|nr:adaptor protein MecA [Alicyclobacillus macrosporangiidus]MCL6600626.1 adaptor protein MecA [Alicyclobacillus macrosporangiidus]
MRVERIAKDKVRIFISYDDLEERGIERDEIWRNGRKVQELFWDMMETAYEQVGFEIAGPIAVEAFTMPTEGVVVIVTRVPSLPPRAEEDEDEDEEMHVEVDVTYYSTFVFRFDDFEDVVRVAHALQDYPVRAVLYLYEGAYHLFLDEDSMQDMDYDAIWAICHEYGEYCQVTSAMLEEYGKPIVTHNTLRYIADRFPLS